MTTHKKGFPEEGELLLCTVTKIFGHSVFVNCEEYNRSGMIHISEISPGRIRNLRDYVVEGKRIICSVLRVNIEKGHVDLSLRRVNDGQRRKKLDQVKQEQKSEKIIEHVAKELSLDKKQFSEEVTEKVLSHYKNITSCFVNVVSDKVSLEELGIAKKAAAELTKVIKERMKPPKILIGGNLSLKNYQGDGISIIKEALKKAQEIGKSDAKVKYVGGGKYSISVTSEDFKHAEKILKEMTETAISIVEKKDGVASFKRTEKAA